MQIVIVVAETIVSVLVGGHELKTRLTIILYFLLVIFQNGQRE